MRRAASAAAAERAEFAAAVRAMRLELLHNNTLGLPKGWLEHVQKYL